MKEQKLPVCSSAEIGCQEHHSLSAAEWSENGVMSMNLLRVASTENSTAVPPNASRWLLYVGHTHMQKGVRVVVGGGEIDG